MTRLRCLIILLLAVSLAFGSGTMPALAGFEPPTANHAMHTSSSDDHGCSEHDHTTKSAAWCAQCPCCLGLLSDLIVLTSPGMARPTATRLFLGDGLRMAPDPAPPRWPA